MAIGNRLCLEKNMQILKGFSKTAVLLFCAVGLSARRMIVLGDLEKVIWGGQRETSRFGRV